MIKWLNNFGIRVRILFAIAITFLMFMAFSLSKMAELNETSGQMDTLQTLADYTPDIGNLIHDLQKERGASAVYIGNNGSSEFSRQVQAQYKLTDKSNSNFNTKTSSLDLDDINGDLGNKITIANRALTQLSSMRNKVQGLQVPASEMAGYYGSTIKKLLDAIKIVGAITKNPDLLKDITAYIALLEAKERAGQERAMGVGGFAAGSFKLPIYNRFVSLIAQQEAFLSTFNATANEDIKAFLASKLSTSTAARIDEIRVFALTDFTDVTPSGVSGAQWYTAMTDKINLFHDVESRFITSISESATVLASDASSGFWQLLILSSLLAIGISFLSLKIAQSITMPLSGIEDGMALLSQGDLEAEILYTDYQSEIGNMAGNVQGFKEAAIEQKRLEEEARTNEESRRQQERESEERDQRARDAELAREQEEMAVREQRAKKMETFIGQFDTHIEDALQSMSSTSSQLLSTAGNMTDIADKTGVSSSAAAAAAEEATTNIHAVAAASEEMSSSINEIARQLVHTTEITNKAVTQAGATKDKMSSLSETTALVEGVVQLINDIADQTNLLALNATIEAARAGEAGRGFAVVASEVKTLATQTSNATDEIGEHVKAIQIASNDAIKAVDDIRSVIDETNEITISIASAVEEQDAATAEIARNVQEAAKGSQEVTSVIVQVSSAATETKTIANDVDGAASEMSSSSKSISSVVDDFLSNIREL